MQFLKIQFPEVFCSMKELFWPNSDLMTWNREVLFVAPKVVPSIQISTVL
jgi:hypothetical protein